MKVRDELGAIVVDEDFACLLSTGDLAVLAPWKLALLTVMQFAEGLLDRQAAEAVRARIDWKYALGLQLSDPGFNFSVFRSFVLGWSKAARRDHSWRSCLRGARSTATSRCGC